MTTQQQTPGSRNTTTKLILIVTAVVGGVALLTAGASAAAQAVSETWSERNAGATGISDVDGVTTIDLDIDAADVTLQFGDVEEVSIEATGQGSGQWQLGRKADTIMVATPRGATGLCFGLCHVERAAVITLPRSLEGVDLGIDLDAGSVTADGKFRDLDVSSDAGEATVKGTARSLDVELNAGSFDADLRDVRKATFEVAVGDGQVTLNGRAPDSVEVGVSAGSLALVLPDTGYRVQSEVSMGEFVNDLRMDKTSNHSIEVELEMGSLQLSAGEKPESGSES